MDHRAIEIEAANIVRQPVRQHWYHLTSDGHMQPPNLKCPPMQPLAAEKAQEGGQGTNVSQPKPNLKCPPMQPSAEEKSQEGGQGTNVSQPKGLDQPCVYSQSQQHSFFVPHRDSKVTTSWIAIAAATIINHQNHQRINPTNMGQTYLPAHQLKFN